MSRNKKLLIWAGVINVLFTAFFIYGITLMLNNIDGFADQLKEIFLTEYGFTSEETAEMLNQSVTSFVGSAICNGLCGISNFVFAFINPKWFIKLKFVNILIAAVNFASGMNFISAILVCIACFSRENQYQPATGTYQTQMQQPIKPQQGMSPDQIREQLKLKGMAEKIELVKHLKAEGSINEEEYCKLIDEIITNGVKE